jgi:hypothetical protein
MLFFDMLQVVPHPLGEVVHYAMRNATAYLSMNECDSVSKVRDGFSVVDSHWSNVTIGHSIFDVHANRGSTPPHHTTKHEFGCSSHTDRKSNGQRRLGVRVIYRLLMMSNIRRILRFILMMRRKMRNMLRIHPFSDSYYGTRFIQTLASSN